MVDSRNKGAAAERELAAKVHEHLGVILVRNLEQARSGGHDLTVDADSTGPIAEVLRRFAIEVKRYRRATPALIDGWWQQARAQAAPAGLDPVLAFREDRQPWRVVVPLTTISGALPGGAGEEAATLSLAGWCAVVRSAAGQPGQLLLPQCRLILAAPPPESSDGNAIDA